MQEEQVLYSTQSISKPVVSKIEALRNLWDHNHMNLNALITTLTCVWLVSPAFANDSRLYPLLSSPLFSSFNKSGEWQVTVAETMIHYECLKCTGKVTASIEVITSYDDAGYTNSRDRYLAERVSLCAQIVQELRGRCIGTHKTRWRLRLEGFCSAYKFDEQLVTEIVFFYQNQYFGPVRGPELIRATINSAEGTPLL